MLDICNFLFSTIREIDFVLEGLCLKYLMGGTGDR